MRGSETYSLWIERIAEQLGFSQHLQRVGLDDTYAPYLFVLAVVILDVPILSTVSYVVHDVTFHPLIDLPAWPLIPLALVVGIFGMRRIRSKYGRARETAGKTDQEIEVSPPTQFRAGLYLFVVIVYLVYTLPNLPEHLAVEGHLVGIIKYLLIIPGVYFVVLSDFLAVYVHGLYFLPLAILDQDVPLDFSKKYGGMEDVGSLLITASIFYFATLALWTTSTILNNPGLQFKTFLLHSVMWGTGVLLFAIALGIVHYHMDRQKRQKIEETTDEIKRSGTDNDVFPYISPEKQAETAEYMVLYVNLDRIEQTRTYPVNTDRLLELIGAILIPVVLQVISLAL